MLRWVLLEKASVSALYSLTRDPSRFEQEPGSWSARQSCLAATGLRVTCLFLCTKQGD